MIVVEMWYTTKRGRDWYVEFPVYIDDAVFKMAPYGRRSESSVKIKRWKAGKYKEQAITLEANKRVELEGAGIPRKALLAPLTFAAWAKQYIEIEGVNSMQRCRSWKPAKPMPQHLYNTTAGGKQLYHRNVGGLGCVGAEGQN